MKRIGKYWYILILMILVGGGIWWWRRPKPMEYEEFVVERGSLREELTVSGALTAEKMADLKFQSGGRLAWVGVKEGDSVRKWQGIASLDKRSMRKSLNKELNDYMNERWNFEGDRDTYDVTTDDLDDYSLSNAARRVLEKAQFDLNNTVLDLEIQTITNEMATIVAPFDGLVSDLAYPDDGVNVAATDVIATVVDPGTVYFSAEVDELDIGSVYFGQQVELVFDAYPDEPLSTTVMEVGFSPITLSGGGTGYEVKIGLPVENSDLKYKLGMNGDATLLIEEKEGALQLPSAAVSSRDGEAQVLVRSGDGVVEKSVEVGLETDDRIEVLRGLDEGEVVVTVVGGKNGKKK